MFSDKVAAHRFILASSSPLFLSLLHPSSHPHPMVYLRGVSYRDLTSLLDFMYKGEVSVEQRYLESFLNTAEELKVKGLSENGSVADDSNGDGVHEEIGDDKKINTDDASNVNMEIVRDENEPITEFVKEIEEFNNETPLTSDPNLTEDQHSAMNTSSASSSLASLKAVSIQQTRDNKVKQTPAKAKRKSLTEPKTVEKVNKKQVRRGLQSPVEELQSLSAKRTSLYGKKLTEEWKTESMKKSQLKPKVKIFQNQTIDSSSSDTTKGKRKLSEDYLASNRLKQQRRIKNSKLKTVTRSREVEIPGVSDKQKAISVSLEFAIEATKEEIRQLEGEDRNEDDLPSLADATDGTIAEVEKVLKLSQEVLGGFDYVDSADDNEDLPMDMDKDVSDPSPVNVSQINQSPNLTPDKSNSISSEICKTSPMNSRENILTPVKKMAIISLMLVKGNSNSTPWKCSICKKLFKSKSSAEEHIELEHVEGKLQ